MASPRGRAEPAPPHTGNQETRCTLPNPLRRRRAVSPPSPWPRWAGCCGADNDNPHRLPQLSPAQPGALVGACEDLAARNRAVRHHDHGATTVAAGTLVVAGQPVPEHCRVTGTCPASSPVDGKTYAIGFEMRLPKDWNGRFFYQGNGGIDGSVVPANGTFGGGAVPARCSKGSRYSAPTPAMTTRRAARRSASIRRHGSTTATRPWASSRPWPSRRSSGVRQGARSILLRRLLQRRAPHAGGGGPLCRRLRRLSRWCTRL